MPCCILLIISIFRIKSHHIIKSTCFIKLAQNLCEAIITKLTWAARGAKLCTTRTFGYTAADSYKPCDLLHEGLSGDKLVVCNIEIHRYSLQYLNPVRLVRYGLTLLLHCRARVLCWLQSITSHKEYVELNWDHTKQRVWVTERCVFDTMALPLARNT